MGLEDLEGCEQFFSKSNTLTASTGHASVFHRQQNIVEYLKYTDAMETSQNLSMFVLKHPLTLTSFIHRQISRAKLPASSEHHCWRGGARDEDEEEGDCQPARL